MAAKDGLATHFERLCDLPPEVQRLEIDKLELKQDERQHLASLLAADRSEGDPIRQAVAEGAAHLEHPPMTRIGAWRLVRELGAGGMGTVFLAERVEGRFEQYVAIKLLRGFPTSESMRRLRQERQILAGLDHPNIARLLDGGETEDDQPWLAMEYVDGLPLLDYVRLHAPSMPDRLALIDAMLAAGAFAAWLSGSGPSAAAFVDPAAAAAVAAALPGVGRALVLDIDDEGAVIL
jgi:serine/threonine-protein kinase